MPSVTRPRDEDLPGILVVGAVLTLLVAINPMSTDTLAPGIPAIRDEFGATTARANLAFSVYVFAFGFMQLVYGPVADRFGRRPVLLGATLVYALASALCSIATSLDLLLLGRLLQGAAASAAPAVARAVIRDLYGPERSGKVMSYVMAAFGIIAIVAPALGGGLVAWFGWRATFYFCIAYALVTALMIAVFLRETRPADAPTTLTVGGTLRQFAVIVPHRAFLLNCGTNLFMYAAMFAWLSGSMLILIDAYGFRADAAGLYFGLGSAGFMLGAALTGRLSSRVAAPTLVIGGGALALAAAVLLTALAAAGVRSGPAVAVPAFLWMLGHGFHYPLTMAGAVAPFPRNAGAASSLIGFVQTCAGAITAFAMGLAFDGTAIPLGLLMGGLTLAALLAYVPFYRAIGANAATGSPN